MVPSSFGKPTEQTIVWNNGKYEHPILNAKDSYICPLFFDSNMTFMELTLSYV